MVSDNIYRTALCPILPTQATRGFSILGTDCFELLVEEPFEEYARIVLEEVKYRPNDQNECMDFRTSGGYMISGEEQQKKCEGGALKRWKRGSRACRHPLAK